MANQFTSTRHQDAARQAGIEAAADPSDAHLATDPDRLWRRAQNWCFSMSVPLGSRTVCTGEFCSAFLDEFKRLAMAPQRTEGRPYRIALISCGAKKAPARCPARDLYTSDLFRKSLAWAESQADQVFVLSALYGAVPLDREIAPYDFRLGQLSKREREQWAYCHVFGGGRIGESGRGRPLLLLAGEEYSQFVRPAAGRNGWAVHEPLAGLQVGQRLAWLKSNLRRIGAVVEAAPAFPPSPSLSPSAPRAAQQLAFW